MASSAQRSAVIIGQCIAHNTRNAAKVRVKRLKFDSNLNMVGNPAGNTYGTHNISLLSDLTVGIILHFHQNARENSGLYFCIT